jgi:hypothetical protein
MGEEAIDIFVGLNPSQWKGNHPKENQTPKNETR